MTEIVSCNVYLHKGRDFCFIHFYILNFESIAWFMVDDNKYLSNE